MKRYYIIFPIVAILVISSIILTRDFVTAQSAGQGLEVSPPSQEVTIDPNGTTTIKAKLRNRSNNALPINVRVEDFTAKGDEGQVELNANSPYSFVNWTKI